MNFKTYQTEFLALSKNVRTLELTQHSELVKKLLSTPQTALFFAGISEEAGEVNGIWKRLLRGDISTQENFDIALKEELGDLIAYVLLLCNLLEYDIEQIIINNFFKLLNRYQTPIDPRSVKAITDYEENGGEPDFFL